jgi:hypothetical protein
MSAADFVRLGMPSVMAEELENRTGRGWAMVGTELQVRAEDPNAPGLSLFRDGIYQYAYFSGQTGSSYTQFDVPFDYAAGTDLYTAVHWSSSSASNTGNIRFGLEYTYAWGYGQADGKSTFGPSQFTYVVDTGHPNDPYHHHTTFFPTTIPGSIVQPNMRFLIRFFRDGESELDTYEDDVFVFGVDFFYQRDKLGQVDRFPPFR